MKNYHYTTAKIITLKTPLLKYSDVAYIRHSDDAIELELFAAGQVLKRFHINHLICVDGEGCMQKSSFNARYLSSAYPPEILQNILLTQPIFKGKNLHKSASGFTQSINTQHYNITYRVNTQQTVFKDKKNHILIKIKDIPHG